MIGFADDERNDCSADSLRIVEYEHLVENRRACIIETLSTQIIASVNLRVRKQKYLTYSKSR